MSDTSGHAGATTTRPYCLRLPLELEPALHDRARQLAISPAAYIKALVVRHLRNTDQT